MRRSSQQAEPAGAAESAEESPRVPTPHDIAELGGTFAMTAGVHDPDESDEIDNAGGDGPPRRDRGGTDRVEPPAGQAPPGRPGSDRAGQDRAPVERAAQDRGPLERAGQDRGSFDRADFDRAGADRAGADRVGAGPVGAGPVAHDRTLPDRTLPDRALPDRAMAGRAAGGRLAGDDAINQERVPDDPQSERGLRGLVGGGSSQVSVAAALRARDAARPTEADLAAAEEELVIVRRGWVPREDLPPRGPRR
jgi:hypothetical protein